ncbi:MAG TPA: hypothetical protein VLN59_17355 [Burkholderiales bacterium]|nr:hypothetical protein [Burkholderiales bacterium]
MALRHVEEFFRTAFKDPQLMSRMLQDNGRPEDCIRNAVKIAGEQGFRFSMQEAAAWLQQQAQKADGELSDAQLGQVSGGAIAATDYALAVSTLTTMSQTRHDIALGAIANMKA